MSVQAVAPRSVVTRAWQRYGRPAAPVLAMLYVPLLVSLAATRWLLGNRAPDVVTPLTFDVRAAFDHSSFILVEAGAWLFAAVAACIGSSRAARAGDLDRGRMLAGAGGLSLLFLADDLFQLHKPVIPNVTGISSTIILTCAGVLVASWAVACRREIARADVAILASSLVLFAVWFAYKAVPGLPLTVPVEISAKLCGIAGWAFYVARVGVRVPGAPRLPRRRMHVARR